MKQTCTVNWAAVIIGAGLLWKGKGLVKWGGAALILAMGRTCKAEQVTSTIQFDVNPLTGNPEQLMGVPGGTLGNAIDQMFNTPPPA